MSRRALGSNVRPRRVAVNPTMLQEVFHVKVDPRRSLVSAEVQYLLKTLGKSAPTDEIEKAVMSVRRTPWSEIAKVLEL